MAKIHVTDREGRKLDVEAKEGLSLMEPLRDVADGVEALCGGMCSCSTCHVFIDPQWAGRLKPPKDDEMELLQGSECYRPGESRLSCQVKVSPEIDGLVVTIAPAE
jgi:2Fe-2S ferredoxin